MKYRPAGMTDAPAIAELIRISFGTCVAQDWEPQAQRIFMDSVSPEKLAMQMADAAFVALAEAEHEIIGFLMLTAPGKLSHLFVHPSRLRQGIARQLWEQARLWVETEHPRVQTVELNATPYAVPAYRALGFYPISEPFCRDGASATRMACWLPGRKYARPHHGGERSGSAQADKAPFGGQ